MLLVEEVSLQITLNIEDAVMEHLLINETYSAAETE